jgi:hypothetical protein
MIYDPITRQQVTILGRYPPDSRRFRMGREEKGTYRFVLVRFGEHLPGFSGGFPIGEERDAELNSLVADDGIRELQKAYDTAPELSGA